MFSGQKWSSDCQAAVLLRSTAIWWTTALELERERERELSWKKCKCIAGRCTIELNYKRKQKHSRSDDNTRKNNFLAAQKCSSHFNTANISYIIHSVSLLLSKKICSNVWYIEALTLQYVYNSCSRKTKIWCDHQSLIFAAFLWPNTANENKSDHFSGYCQSFVSFLPLLEGLGLLHSSK